MPDIRKAGIEDIPLLQQLSYIIWPIAYGNILSKGQLDYMLDLIYSDEALTNQIVNLEHQFILAFSADKAVGFASFGEKKKEDPSLFRLHKLYVLPDQQKSGIGKGLIEHILKEIKTAGAKQLELNVNRENTALQFYDKIGFVIFKEEDIDIGGGYFMNDYVMRLEL